MDLGWNARTVDSLQLPTTIEDKILDNGKNGARQVMG